MVCRELEVPEAVDAFSFIDRQNAVREAARAGIQFPKGMIVGDSQIPYEHLDSGPPEVPIQCWSSEDARMRLLRSKSSGVSTYG